tara:strand:- start:27281 stop:27481 length:201 start_codon:yes stop_codon:yes gene_type:complete
VELERFFPKVGDIICTIEGEREGLIVDIQTNDEMPPITTYNVLWLDDFVRPLSWLPRKEFRIYELK